MANSLESASSLQELTNVSTIMRDTFSFIWSIEQFGKFMNRKYEFSSPLFSPKSKQETRWRMVVFPGNMYPEGQHLALRLQKASDDDKSCSVMYEISIIDRNGTYLRKQTREKVFRNCLDFDDCLVISNRELKEENLLLNGSLTIDCKMDLLMAVALHEEPLCPTPARNDSFLMKYDSSASSIRDKDIDYSSKTSNAVSNNNLRATAGSLNDNKSAKTIKGLELLSDDFKSMYLNQYQCDIVIHGDDGDLRAHKAILEARSEYFRQVCRNATPSIKNVPEIEIPGIKKVALDAVLHYLYTGQLCQLTFQLAIDLLAAGKTLHLDKLGDEVQGFLKTQIDVSNVTDILRISKKMQMDVLKNSALKFVSVNHKEVAKTEKWNEMIRDDPHAAGEVLLTVASFQKTPTYRH